MALDIEEQQQVEQVKKWLAEYGLTLIVSILVAVVLLFGYQRWSGMRERAMNHASVRYEQLLDDLAVNKTEAADQAANYLIMRYPRSTYAKLAELLLAQRDVNEGKFEEARSKLESAAARGSIPAVKEIARLRLARLQLQLNQAQAALDTLSRIDTPEYLPTASAVRGDAYLMLNKVDLARQAYQQAVTGLPDGAMLRSIVSMKLNDLPA